MKKILALFMVTALSSALFACGGNRNKNTTSPLNSTSGLLPGITSDSGEITTPHPSSTTRETNSHPTVPGSTEGSTASQNGTSADFFTTPPVGTAPGGSTSVR